MGERFKKGNLNKNVVFFLYMLMDYVLLVFFVIVLAPLSDFFFQAFGKLTEFILEIGTSG